MTARILIVDDDERICSSMQRLLRAEGHHCDAALGVVQAREELASGGPFELLLCDMRMPDGSGLDLVDWVNEQLPDLHVLMITGVDDPEVAAEALERGADGYLVKPLRPNEVRIQIAQALRRREAELTQRAGQQELVESLRQRSDELWRTLNDLARSDERATRQAEQGVQLLVNAARHRDNASPDHLERVRRYTAFLAKGIGIRDADAELMGQAAQLHDVGYLALPERVLRKAGVFSDSDREVMHRHPLAGAQLLDGSASPVLRLAAEIAAGHHERWDGSGYPHATRGDAIPIAARIVAVADVFDALSSRRPHRPAFAIGEVVEILRGEAEGFDPTVLSFLFDSISEVAAIRMSLGDA